VRVDVVFGATAVTPADVVGRVVAVIDVLRASTTIATALDNGARCVVPFEHSEEVVSRSKGFERRDVRLAGERRMLPIPGFDLGNSPREFTREAIEGRTILLSTTNGTPALVAAQGARDIVVASYVNLSASLAFLRAAARGGIDVTLICAGRDRHFALEDAACAGRYARGIARRLAGAQLNDAAQVCALLDRRYGTDIDQLFADAEHGRALVAAGFGDDLALCGAIDAHPVVPVYADRQIVKLGPDWER
jgi:2-phosphosulfolactate phosphatase